jgi:hypothetical protein
MAKQKEPKYLTLNEQMKEILRIAQKYNVESNFFFITTFKRYQVQIKILQDLEKIINDEGLIVSKEYVKGRKNVYSHPAIKDYNRTADSANKTVAMLLKIINVLRKNPVADDEDPLVKLLSGGSDYDNDTDEWSGAEDDDDDADEDQD